MYFRFDNNYISNSDLRVAMLVMNRIVKDSRVLKTAGTLSKMGFRVHLFGITSKQKKTAIDGFPFKITLVPSPKKQMIKENVFYDAAGERNDDLFMQRAALNYLEILEENEYDFLHTHDTTGLAIGGLISERGFVAKKGWIHDIHEYVIGSTHLPEKKQNFFLRAEQKYIKKPDLLTSVSPILSEKISWEYNVSKPDLVLNTPRIADFDLHYVSIRQALGINEDVPLLVYCGNVRQERGIHTAVEGLSLLPEVHLALLTNSGGEYMEDLLALARKSEVSDRLHIHQYVPSTNVTSFLRGASAGIRPATKYGNSDLALPNKLFEYLHAGLPVISSDSTAAIGFINEHKCGVTYPSGDVSGFADSVKKILSEFPEGLPNVAQGSKLAGVFCWEEQEKAILSQYHKLLQKSPAENKLAEESEVQPVAQIPSLVSDQPGVLTDVLSDMGVKTECLEKDIICQFNDYSPDDKKENIISSVQNIMAEKNFGQYKCYHYHVHPAIFNKKYFFPHGFDLLLLKSMGKKVFFQFHGSEIRLSDAGNQAAPNECGGVNLFGALNEKDKKAFTDYACGVCDAAFVPDPELQCYASEALIVPALINIPEIITPKTPDGNTAPVIVCTGGRREKESEIIINSLNLLKNEGYDFVFHIIDENAAEEERLSFFRDADVIVDNLDVGWYSITAIEGMVLGKAVVSNVNDNLRHYLPYPSPLIFSNPANIQDVLRYLLDNQEEILKYGQRGRKFVEDNHDSAKITEGLLSIYRKPVCSVKPVAAAEFSEYQVKKLQKEIKRIIKEKEKIKAQKQKKKRAKLSLKVNKFVKETRKKGTFAAVKKTAKFVKKKIL